MPHNLPVPSRANKAVGAANAPKQVVPKVTPSMQTLPVQCKLSVGAVDDPMEREADAMADKVMGMPAGTGNGSTFSKPSANLIQREDKPGDTLLEGAKIVKENLDENEEFTKYADEKTEQLKKKVWDDQPAELKAGVLGFGLGSLGILGSLIASDPGFRADTVKLLDDKNLALPLKLLPYHEYFPLSSFKFKLPEGEKAPIKFETEFEFKPYLDLMRERWKFFPKTDLTLGLDAEHSDKSGFGITGGSIKLKFWGGFFNVQGYLHQTLPVTPMLMPGRDPGAPPMWMMRSLPGQSDDKLAKGSGVFISFDFARLPELLENRKKRKRIQRKCADCEEEEKVHRKETGADAPGVSASVEKTLQSPGKPMDNDTRSFMEARFGYDFGKVQIHNDARAGKSSADINAMAYTHSNHVVFGEGQYRPETEDGRRLLAHELTHVVQQGAQGETVQRHRLLDKTESAPCLQQADTVIKSLENNMQSGSKYGKQPYIQEAVKMLRGKYTAGKIKCYAFDGIVHGITDYGGDEVRLDGVNLSWINETALLHEGVHAYHASQYSATAKLYDTAQKAGKEMHGNNPADLKLMKWKAWTEYWAYRSNYEYQNPTRQQPMKDEEIDKYVKQNKDVSPFYKEVLQWDSSFDPATYTPT